MTRVPPDAQADLTAVEVLVIEPEPGARHVEIDLAGKAFLGDPEFAHLSDQEKRAVAAHLAGLLARVIVAVLPLIEAEAQTHRCRPRWNQTPDGRPVRCFDFDFCGAGQAADESLLFAGADFECPPTAYVNVPTERREHWLRTLRLMLAAVDPGPVTGSAG